MLQAFGAPLDELKPADFASDGFFQMGRPPVRIDILMTIEGLTFDEAWPNRQNGDFDGVPAMFLAAADLITNKTVSSRPQDLLDVESLKNAFDQNT